MLQSSKNHPTGFAAVLVLVVIAVLVAGGFGLFKLSGGEIEFPGRKPTTTPTITPVITSRVCTMDVKICPDGSYVSRVSPDCNFTPCPSTVVPTVSSEITPKQSSSKSITDESLNSDLKSLESAGLAIDSGIGNIDQSLNDKPDNLVE